MQIYFWLSRVGDINSIYKYRPVYDYNYDKCKKT